MPTVTPIKIKYRHYPTAGLREHMEAPPHGFPAGAPPAGGIPSSFGGGDAGVELSLKLQLQGDTSEEVFRLLNSV